MINTEAEPTKQPVVKKRKKRVKLFLMLLSLLGFVAVPVVGFIVYGLTIYPSLPDAASLKDVSYQVPLKIVTADNQLISEIGTKKRIPLDYSQIPEKMTQAIISSEDSNFFHHGGVDFKGLGRAAYELVTTGAKKSGGSTITMQVARNFFLSKKKSYLRKLNEIVLSYKIEHQLSKQEILALYLNKIFLGYRSYGVAAAAQTYYGKKLKDLSLDEFAMIAGLPKAPSTFNPIYNPERAELRRNYVLRRMYDNQYISESEMKLAQSQPVHAKLTGARIEVEAGYVAEMARAFAVEKFGEDALKNGLTITTSIDSQLQKAANDSIRKGLQDYERRHGYRGAITHVDSDVLENKTELQNTFKRLKHYVDLEVAAVTSLSESKAELVLMTGEVTSLDFSDMLWAKPYIDVNKKGEEPQKVEDVLQVGDVIYVRQYDGKWQLSQSPKAEAALVSIDANNGAIQSLVGGYDFFRSKFNRVTQAKRQIGSNIKPFLYSSALARGMTAASIINDAPVVFHDDVLEDTWRPENYSGRFYGPTRLRTALTNSRNLVSIRLLREVGIRNAISHIQKFGFLPEELNNHRDLSLALGTAEFSPLEVVQSYATIANTGFSIEPYLIDNIKDFDGSIIYQAEPLKACSFQCFEGDPTNAPRVVSEQNAYIISSMLQDVINHGTARKAKVLKRLDIAGKTGTTNDQKDAWFSGYNPNIVTTVWLGFDKPSTLGRVEYAGRAALPIWIDYMRVALENEINAPLRVPEGLVNIPINRKTGEAVPADTPNAFFEVFREENAPEIPNITEQNIEKMTQELFE
jgi:penicillin-binding protein 1A